MNIKKNGETRGEPVKLIDWEHPENNEFLAVNQFTVIEDNHNHRPDIVIFINGLPLVVIELKNAADEKANLNAAYNQLQTYKQRIPSLFTYNALLVISDGLSARAGSLTAGFNRFSTWKTTTGENQINELEILTNGLLNKQTLLDLIRHFTVFEKSKTEDIKTGIVSITTIKKIAAYHQYYAVNKAVESIVISAGFPSPIPSQGERDQDLKVALPLGEGLRERADIEDLGYRGGLAVTTLLERVRELRKNQTSAEKIFWEVVRAKRFLGLKFRRQHQIGNYIVDFYCHDYKLVIELDGGIHNQPEQQKRDRQREEYLKSLGLNVLRFTNQEIFQNLETVLENIIVHLSPSTSEQGARGEGDLTSEQGARGEGDRANRWLETKTHKGLED